MTAGFHVTAVNKGIGCTGFGQAVVVVNHPRTLDGRSVYEWPIVPSGSTLVSDQRTAVRVSQKIESTLKTFDFQSAAAYYDKIRHEYYIVFGETAIVNNTENGTWYIYHDFPAACLMTYKDELYFGTPDGFIRHVSRDYLHDCGAPIDCQWVSGAWDFGSPSRRKSSDRLWVVLKPEEHAEISVTVETDRTALPNGSAGATQTVSAGVFGFDALDFGHFLFNSNNLPQTQRQKLPARGFAWYKLILSSSTGDTTCTVQNVTVRVQEMGQVR